MSDATDYITRLREERDRAQVALMRQSRRADQLELERDQARANARTLAHSYTTDSRPPQRAVDESLAYPVIPECVRRGGPLIEVK